MRRPSPRHATPSAFRWLALALLLATTPVIQQAIAEVGCLVGLADDCDDGCEGQGTGECPGPCQTCFCCPHPKLVTSAAIRVPELAGVREPLLLVHEDGRAEGYGSLPFRPPTA